MPSSASGTALLITARTCWSFGRISSRCAAMYSSTDFGIPFFIPVILCFGMRVFLADIRYGSLPEMAMARRTLGAPKPRKTTKSWLTHFTDEIKQCVSAAKADHNRVRRLLFGGRLQYSRPTQKERTLEAAQKD